jgi:hypothetical protein
MFGGLPIVPHQWAVRTVHRVVRHPTRKRRRNWRVVRVTEPCAFQVGGVLYVHPSLVDKLREATR